jgi:hypothetical protein
MSPEELLREDSGIDEEIEYYSLFFEMGARMGFHRKAGEWKTVFTNALGGNPHHIFLSNIAYGGESIDYIFLSSERYIMRIKNPSGEGPKNELNIYPLAHSILSVRMEMLNYSLHEPEVYSETSALTVQVKINHEIMRMNAAGPNCPVLFKITNGLFSHKAPAPIP